VLDLMTSLGEDSGGASDQLGSLEVEGTDRLQQTPVEVALKYVVIHS